MGGTRECTMNQPTVTKQAVNKYIGGTLETFNEPNDKDSHTKCKTVKAQRRHNDLAITCVVRSPHTRFGANTATRRTRPSGKDNTKGDGGE